MKNPLAALTELQKQMEKDKDLPLTTNLVFGEGSIASGIVLIGEAPGLNEDLERRPFVGRSGKLLTASLAEVGIKRADVYITNIVKRRPPENRDPLPEEIEAYKPYLKKQLEIINPKIIITLGRFSMNYFLPTAKITRDQGKVFRLDNRLIVPVFHPAAALRSTGTMTDFKKSLRRIPKILDKYEELINQSLS